MVAVFKWIWLLSISISIASCNSDLKKNSSQELVLIFEELSSELEDDLLKKFCLSTIDSAGMTLNLISRDVERKISASDPDSELNKLVDFAFGEDEGSKIQAIAIAYHIYCNSKKIDLNIVDQELRKINAYSNDKFILAQMQEKFELSEENNSKFNIGDTINGSVATKNETIIYYGGNLPDSLYFRNHYKLTFSGILLDKYYGLYFSKADSFNLIFQIKILQVIGESKKDSDNLKFGDTLNLHVTYYDRLLNKGLIESQ